MEIEKGWFRFCLMIRVISFLEIQNRETIDENKVERSNREKYYIHISCFK